MGDGLAESRKSKRNLGVWRSRSFVLSEYKHGHQTLATSKKGRKHLKCIFVNETRKKNKSMDVRSLELLLVFCWLISARSNAAGIREEFEDVEAWCRNVEEFGKASNGVAA